MRRKIYQVTDKALIKEVLDSTLWGTLALVDGGRPYQTPLNFAYIQSGRSRGEVMFHCSLKGRRMGIVRAGQDDGDGSPGVHAHFSVVEELSLIPSHFTSEDYACNLNQYYISLFMEGRLSEVTDPEEKAANLNILVRKHQPEGRYREITLDDPDYRKKVRGTGMLRLQVEKLSAKFHLSQELKGAALKNMTEALRKRGSPLDKRTLAWIERLG